MERLKLVANRPEIISLQYQKGLQVTGQFGDQVMFTLADGRKWYTTPFVASKVDALNVGKGEPFEICKRETIDGNRRKVEFELRYLTPETQATVRPSVASTRPNGKEGQVVSQPASQSTSTMTADTNLDLALRYAIDSAAAAEQYAKTIDYALRFTSEDIRCMALSKFIAMDRSNGGGKWSN